MKIQIIEMHGSLNDRIEGTNMDEQIPYLLVKLIERLVDHK